MTTGFDWKAVVLILACLGTGTVVLSAGGAKEGSGTSTLTVATVNNPDMGIMQQLSADFTRSTGIQLSFVVLPENELRQKVTEDVGLGSGKYDVVTIGTYDAPIWGKWREPFRPRGHHGAQRRPPIKSWASLKC